MECCIITCHWQVYSASFIFILSSSLCFTYQHCVRSWKTSQSRHSRAQSPAQNQTSQCWSILLKSHCLSRLRLKARSLGLHRYSLVYIPAADVHVKTWLSSRNNHIEIKIVQSQKHSRFNKLSLIDVQLTVRGGRVVRGWTLRSRGCGFDSHPWLLCTNAYSACHPSGVG